MGQATLIFRGPLWPHCRACEQGPHGRDAGFRARSVSGSPYAPADASSSAWSHQIPRRRDSTSIWGFKEELHCPKPISTTITSNQHGPDSRSTFFQSADWPMKDSSDPLEGWHFREILDFASGPASNDVYGKLYGHLQTLLSAFRRRLSSHGCKFHMLNMNAAALPKHLNGGTFARIEVSYILAPCSVFLCQRVVSTDQVTLIWMCDWL